MPSMGPPSPGIARRGIASGAAQLAAEDGAQLLRLLVRGAASMSEQRTYQLDGQADDRGRAGRSARRPLGDRGLREHAISETLCYGWRETLLEGGREALAGEEERLGERELRRKVAELERSSGVGVKQRRPLS